MAGDSGAEPKLKSTPTEDRRQSRSGDDLAPEGKRRDRRNNVFLFLIPAVLVLDVAAVALVPPFAPGNGPANPCGAGDIACYIQSAIEYPPPAVVLDLLPSGGESGPAPMVYFHPSISSTILTMWLVMAFILLLAIAATSRMKLVPGRLQNAVEWAYEFGRDFATSMGGEGARRYYPVFAAFFVLILFCNWSGLIPPIGKVEQLRAPTSDVNVTIGLALTSFVLFEGEGFRRLGVRGYLRKFFPIGEFRHGLGAGLLAMYVGVIELFLEFVKPVTLAMRLFGNIYGGEVAVAVITALTISIIPVLLVGLEALLNVIQALIFSILTLMFILIAVESHGGEDVESAMEGTSRSAAA